MLFTNAQALEAARTLRSVLSQLLDAESAEAIDRQLAQLLNQTDLDENTQVDRILKILDNRTETQTWWDNFRQNNTSIQKSYSGLAGDPTLQPVTKYVCPIANDYTWYREDNSAIPLCPTHLVRLVPAQP